MPSRCRSVLLSLCLFALIIAPLWAQTSLSGALGGGVRDAHGAAVAGARIAAVNQETGERVEVQSGADGSYRFLELKPGEYRLRVTAVGFADWLLERATVEVGRRTEVAVTLNVAGHKETVEVREEAPAVNTATPDFASNLTTATLENLPINGRRWSNFALLTPGANLDGDFGLISFRGISGLLNNSMVDGADNNQAFYSEERGRTRISYVISQASVREFQVNTANFGAEYGRAAGAVVNSVTRSGGEHFHGHLFYYDRDNRLGATNAFTVVPVQVNGAWTTEHVKPLDRRQQMGGAVGGPIVTSSIPKDKLFYYVSADVQRRDYPGVGAAGNPSRLFAPPCVTRAHYNIMSVANRALVQVCTYDELYTLTRNVMPLYSTDSQAITAFDSGIQYLNSLLGEVPRRADHQIYFAKLDYRLRHRQLLSVSYNHVSWGSPAGVQTEPVVQRGVASFGYSGVQVDMLSARLTSILNSHLTSQLRYSLSRDYEYQTPQKPAPGEPVGANGLAPQVNVLNDSSGFSFGTPATMPQRALPDEFRNEVAETVSWLHGRHLVKFGGDLNLVRDRMNNLYAANGAYSYSYRDDFFADLYQWQNQTGTLFRGYSSFDEGFGPVAWSFHTLDTAVFAQDEWRVARRLVLSFGLRWEHEAMPAPQAPNVLLPGTESFPAFYGNFGPRFGFAWDPTGTGKTAVRGGYGIFYARINNSTISSALTNTGAATAQRTYQFCYTVTSYCSLVGPVFPNLSAGDPYTTSLGGNVVEFARNMREPSIQQADLIVERAVAHNTILSASYLLSLARELPNFIDTNLDPASRVQVEYTFDSDYYSGAQGPYYGHKLIVPVYKSRLNSAFQTITEIRSNVNASYNAFVVQLHKVVSEGLGFRVNYTWSHALDNNQSSTTYTTYNNTLSPAPFTYYYDGVAHTVTRPDYGNSTFDVRQRLNATMHWSPRPLRHHHGVMHTALNHWTISPIVQVATGRPFSEYVSGNPPVSTCAGCLGYMGTGGNLRLPFLQRNSFRMGDFYNVDLRLLRRIRINEHQHVEVLAEAFNLFNHQNITSRSHTYYTVYKSTLEYDSNFDTPTGAANTIYREREVQLGVRWYF